MIIIKKMFDEKNSAGGKQRRDTIADHDDRTIPRWYFWKGVYFDTSYEPTTVQWRRGTFGYLDRIDQFPSNEQCQIHSNKFFCDVFH